MVNHYTANKRLRSDDAYTPGGKAGFRPDYATIVYTKILKTVFPDTPVVIGGIEASMRRFVHYDYWSDKLMKPILVESGADLLLYGMGEQALRQLIKMLKKGVPFQNIRNIPQTVYLLEKLPGKAIQEKWKTLKLFSYEECLKDKKAYAKNFRFIEEESNRVSDVQFIQEAGGKTIIVNPPFPVMSEKEIDASFDLPYTRKPHPRYFKKSPIPAYEMIKFSVNLHRGCFGGCSFCTISAHQGKQIASRSVNSILQEVEAITKMDDFKGYISDLGGPTANMYKMSGYDLSICNNCSKVSCIYPHICRNLNTNHQPLVDIYRRVASHPLVKKATIGSGIRYDLFLSKHAETDRKNAYSLYASQLIRFHVSGRLKVAPEHHSEHILQLMRKPSFDKFAAFKKLFDNTCKKYLLNQQLIPYFISSHPGCALSDMAELAVVTKEMAIQPEQVQSFTPTPMTLSTVMYYTGTHPYTFQQIRSSKQRKQRQEQNIFFFWHQKQKQKKIQEILKRINRTDLINRLYGDRQGRRNR